MLHRLPAELFVHVIRIAAYEYRISDRQSVVNLAMICRTIYDIVCPILHHTLIVTDGNAKRLESLTSSIETFPPTKRILSHVRSFHSLSRRGCQFNLRLLVNVESIESLPAVSLVPLAKLKRMHITDFDFRRAVFDQIPLGVFQALTHITGLLPMVSRTYCWDLFFADPASWMRSLLDMLPAVIHLGLAHDLPWGDDGDKSIARFDCKAVGIAVRTALREYPRIQCIAIRVGGKFAERRWADLKTVLRDVGDPRVKVWSDLRPLKDWNDYMSLRILDVKEGRTLWAEAHSF